MKVEYDPVRDLLYIWLGVPGRKAARTDTVTPGMYADFDAQGRLIGLEVLDASEVLGPTVGRNGCPSLKRPPGGLPASRPASRPGNWTPPATRRPSTN